MSKNIIFDWSGVVKDAVDAQIWKVNKIFEKFGAPQISKEEFQKTFVLPYMDFYTNYLPDLNKEEQDILYKEFSFSDECPVSYSYPGIADLIKEFKSKGYYLAIVSSDLSQALNDEIKEYDLENVFDDIAHEVHDKSESVFNLVKDKNLDKNETYFIGDSNHEIEVAKKTGIKSIAVTWGFTSEEKLKSINPDFLVHNVKELRDIII